MLRASRVFSFSMTLVAVALLIYFGSQGALGPAQDIVSVPLTAVQSFISDITHGVTGVFDAVRDFRRLEARNHDLEEALAVYQAELAELREKGARLRPAGRAARLQPSGAGRPRLCHVRRDRPRHDRLR